MDGDGHSVPEQAARARDTTWAHLAARVGLGSRALIYGALTVLVVQVAVHARAARGADTDQSTSLLLLGESAAGVAVLIALVVAVVCYAVWRASEAWLGTADPGDGRLPRVQAAVEGVAYLPFGYAALAVVLGDDQPARQGSNYRSATARVLGSVTGQVVVTLVGAVVLGVGMFFVVQGLRRTFLGHFDFESMPVWARSTTRWSGSLGCVGRGLMFALAGVLIMVAAITTEPSRAGGIDAALDILARRSYGPELLLLAALGFGSFAVFAVCEGIWRRI